MGLKKFQIVFDNPYATYFSDQQVSGRLIISVDSPKKIRGIVIRFKGEAEVKWQASESRKNDDGTSSNVTVEYTGQEQYFENKFNLLGGGTGETIIPEGENTYPFVTHLPPNLPPSFEGEFGFIRYTVKAILDRPWKFDQEVKAAFTVITPLDLNTHATAKNPVKLEAEKFLCCLCCKSGPISLVLSLPASGYVPGQDIPFIIEVDNNSNTVIDSVDCVLRKKLQFHVSSPSREVKRDKITLNELKLDSVAEGGSKVWSEAFKLPPLPPSNLTGCNIIDLDYDLQVIAVISGLHNDLEVTTPIIVGTVPLVAFHEAGVRPPTAPIVTGWDGKSEGNGVPTQTVASPGWGSPQQPGDPSQVPLLQPFGAPGQPQPGLPYPQPSPHPSPQPSPQPGLAYPRPYPHPSPQPGLAYPQPSPHPSPQPSPQPGLAYPRQPATAPGFQLPGGQLPPSSLYPTMPPPTFEQSQYTAKTIQDSGDNKYTQGTQPFAPMYPVYNLPMTTLRK
ncbi:arrestin domain-containing protein 3-like [Bacillus rossius redtenbacheri]|uniref:arrestin domain-containing protein 3-like n=1 Tax=Bacillus rossius redtenbacheri TaxID=93214 RepID=UPI002FDEBDC8